MYAVEKSTGPSRTLVVDCFEQSGNEPPSILEVEATADRTAASGETSPCMYWGWRGNVARSQGPPFVEGYLSSTFERGPPFIGRG